MIRKYLILLGVVVALVALAFGLYRLGQGPFMLSWGRLMLADELKGASFITDQGPVTTLYHSLHEKEMVDGRLISATEDASGSARIIQKDDNFTITLDNAPVVYDKKPRVGISRSPDGKKVAYAEAVDSTAFIAPSNAPLLSVDPKIWRVVVYEPSTKTSFSIGYGAAPFFLDDTHVAWMAPAGLAVADLSSGFSKVFVPETKGRVPSAALLSPDHSIVGWYSENTRTATLYKISGDKASPLPVVAIPEKVFSLALGNDGLYGLHIQSFMSSVVKQPLSDAQPNTVMRLPSGLRIERLFLGNI